MFNDSLLKSILYRSRDKKCLSHQEINVRLFLSSTCLLIDIPIKQAV